MAGIVYNGNTGYNFKINGVTPDVYYNGTKIWPTQTATLQSYKLSFPISQSLANWGVKLYFRTKNNATIPVTATSGEWDYYNTNVSESLDQNVLSEIFTGPSGCMWHGAGTLDLYIKPSVVNQQLIYTDSSNEGYWPQSAYYYNHYSDNTDVYQDVWTEAEITARPVVFTFNVVNH